MKGAWSFPAGWREGAGRLFSALGFRERRCVACREPFEPDALPRHAVPSPEETAAFFLCPGCRTQIRRREAGFCPYCGEPSALEDAPCTSCSDCMMHLPPWNDFLFFGVYEGLLRDLVLRAKFGGSLAALDMLGLLLAGVCAGHYEAAPAPSVVIPMPLHNARLRERGFNQCLELARPVVKALGVPLCTDVLVKRVSRTPQAMLGREERRKLAQPFEAVRRVDGLHILLIDDVCTTRATMQRAVECLLAAGAFRVDAAVVARSSRHGQGGGSALP